MEPRFLYASRRDVIQDTKSCTNGSNELWFLYASRRDVIQDMFVGIRVPIRLPKSFLYASRRDVIQDGKQRMKKCGANRTVSIRQ